MADPIRPAGRLPGAASSGVQNLADDAFWQRTENLRAMQVQNSPANRTAQAAARTVEEARTTNTLLRDLLSGNAAQDEREQKMVRLTIISVVLSAVAALSGVAALIVALVQK